MEPLSALSVASAVLQIVDFSCKVISRTKEAHHSAVEEHSFLEDATSNLTELLEETEKIALKDQGRFSAFSNKSKTEKQLQRLRKESQDVADTLYGILDGVKHKKSGEDRNSFGQGLRSVLVQNKLSELKGKLDLIRSQVDTSLLVAIHANSAKPTPKIEDKTEQRVEVIRAVKVKRWDPSNSEDVARFSHLLQSDIVEQDVETRFCEMVLARLFFTDMDHRYEAIPEAYENTFRWLFDQDRDSNGAGWDSYTDWLSANDGHNIYWITGKPGSGKSTLMKYLSQEPQTTTYLENWKDGKRLIRLSFYFWNSGNDDHYTKLLKHEPDNAKSLVKNLADKAEGVFLWVSLVVQSLLEGFSNADRMSDLAARLEALPRGLKQLYQKLCDTLEPDHLRHACQIFRLMEDYHKSEPQLLELWFADNEDCRSAIKQEIKHLSDDEIKYREETMKRRLDSRCRGLLETSTTHTIPTMTYVRWIHRTARDFITSEPMWSTVLEVTGHDTFDAMAHWANAHLAALKAIPGEVILSEAQLISCISRSLLLEFRLQLCDVEYLDEVRRAAMVNCDYYRNEECLLKSRSRIKKTSKIQCFLDFAVSMNLANYVRLKGPLVTRDEVLHAAQFRDARYFGKLRLMSIVHRDVILSRRMDEQDFQTLCSKKVLDQALNEVLRDHDKRYQKEKWKKRRQKFLGLQRTAYLCTYIR
ncbi:hypothetical protein NX059_006930 [Plenodomus lindquistii]|nr:hypothetical protein NX059_006930 [Plenodomus lindquistii]